MNKTDGSVSLMSQEQGRAINHLEALRARLLRGGRLTKFKGILASIAPTLAGVTLAAGVAVAPAAMAVTVNDPAGPVSQTVNNDDVNVTNVGTLSVSSGSAIDITHTGTGNVTVTSTPTGSITNTDTGTPAAGVRVSNNTAGGPNSNVTVNLNDVTAVSTSQAAVDIGNRSVGGTTSLTATGTITSSGGHAIRINGVDGNAGYGAMAGPLTINVQDLKGAADGIQIVNSIGTAAAPQAIKITTGDINAGNVGIETYNGSGALLNGNTTITTGTITSTADAISIRSGTGTVGITTGDIDAGGNGINLASQINSVDGATTVKTGTIKAGGEGVAIESGDDAKNYAIDVTTGDVTTGGTGFSVNQSGVGSLSVTTGNVNAGTATASNINGFQNAGGYGIRMDSDPHGTTTATQSAFNLTAGNVTVKDTTGALAGTGVAFGTINNGGNGNTTATVGNIQAGTGLIYNRNGTGAVNLTTGDITASTGDGLNVGNDITHNDVSVKTGNVSAKGYGIYANTQVDAGKLTVTAGDVTAGNTGLYLVHSGTKDFTVTAGDVTSTGAGGVFLWNDGSNPATSPTTLKATVDSITATGIGAELRKDSVGDLSFESTGLVKSTGGAGIQLDNFNNGNVNIAADAGVDAKGNGIDLGGSVNGGANVGTVAITSGGTIKAGGIGINADTGSVTTGTTINVADMDTGSTGVNWINSGTKPFTFTSTGTITAGGIGINLTNDGGSTTSPDGQATINVNNITTPNNMAISVNSAATKGTTINVNGAIHTTAANDLTGDGMHVTEATGPLNINIAKGASITSYTNTMEIQNTNATAPTTVNVDGKLISSADGGAVDGVIWDWNHPNSTLNANINDGSTVQAADKAGFAVTDNSGDSNVIVAKTAAVTGGFRMGAGNDAVTFNGTDMTSVYTLDGGGGSTYTTGGAGDVLTLNDVSNFTRNLQTAGQGIQNWDVVALNGGKADLQGTLTLSPTGEFINGKDASGNPAVLTIGAGHAGDNLTITGNYVGAGGNLTLDVDSSVGAPTGSTTPGVAGPTAADTLNVGGSTSGVTAISLNDVTPTGDVSSQKDINVVNVAGTSDPNAFVLADGPAVMGGHAYLLQQGDSASHLSGTVAAADLATVKNWYLNPEPCPAGGFNSSNNTGTTLGCKTDDVLTTNGSTTVTGNFEGAGGNNQLYVSDGASVDGIVAGGNVGADSSAPVNENDLIVINTTGSVGGVQGDLGSNLIYVVGSSTVKGDVDGNGGSQANPDPSKVTNQIVIGGAVPAAIAPPGPGPVPTSPDPSNPGTGTATVTGNVNVGDAVGNVWVLDGGDVKGNVNGGNVGNSIVLNGGAVGGAINGGDGADTIALMQGTVGSVAGGAGNDIIALNGATVANAITDGDGNDNVTLTKGSASSVTVGNGSNKISLAGASIAGAITAGNGGDAVNLSGGSAASVTTGTGADQVTLSGAKIAGAIDAGDGTNTVALNGGSAGSVSTGAGNDTVTLAGAAISGAINAGDGTNTVDLSGGSAASVTTGTGVDQVTLSGAKIAGAINAGDGTNTVALNGGSAGSVSTGAGNDTVTLAGAAISGAINAGDGTNTVALNSGSAGSVSTGAGNDTVTLAGATISGAISAGDGTNTVALDSGSAASVTTGTGTDQVTLAGANIAGAIDTGAGNDTVDLTSGSVASVSTGAGADTVNVAGKTFTLGTTKLDGGTAGEGNTLNLNNVDQTLTTPQNNLVNWDTVNATDSTLTVNGGDSLTAAQVNLMDTTIRAPNGFTVNGNLTLDPSTIDLQNGVAGGAFVVAKNYNAVGKGNTLAVDANFATTTADELQVGGNVTGTMDVKVKDVTPAGKKASGKDVTVVTIGGPTGSASNFDLAGGPVTSGVWTYNLANGTATPAARTVVLHPTLNLLAALYSASMGALADTFNSLPTLEERVGQREWLTRGNGTAFDGMWVRFDGDRSLKRPDSSTIDYSTLNKAWGVQGGLDFIALDNAAGDLRLGVTAQYKGMDAHVHSSAGGSSIVAHGSGMGVNVTWNGVHGGYVDLQGHYNKVRASMATAAEGQAVNGANMDSEAASVEVGKRFVIGSNNKSALVPQVQYAWGLLQSDPFVDNNGVHVDLGDAQTSLLRAGMAYEFHPDGLDMRNPDGDGRMFYGIFNVLENLAPRNGVVAQGETLSSKDDRTWGQAGVGGSLALGKNSMIYGQVTYLQSFTTMANNGVGGTIGVRINW